MSDHYVYNSIAKGIKKPFQGFDISTKPTARYSNGTIELSSNPNDYNLSRFDRKYADDHSFPIATVIPLVREAVLLLKENVEVNQKKVNASDAKLEEKPEVHVFKDSKHIKSLTVKNNKENIFEYADIKNKEAIDEIIGNICILMNEANLQIQDQMAKIHEKLMVNNIELAKGKNSMFLVKDNQVVEITGSIKAKQLKEYLFLLSNQWTRNPKIQKVIKVKVEKNGFAINYENQKFTLTKTNGEFSEFQKEVIQELKAVFPIA